MKEEVMSLWKTCFHDTDEFVRFYFERKYKEENALLWRDERGKAVSALQMLPYPMTFWGEVVDTSYISGACTLPEARSQGIMWRLLTESFRKMRERGVAFTTLIPQEAWLYGYYARLGYAPVFRFAEERYVLGECRVDAGVRMEVVESADGVTEELFAYFSRKAGERDCCVLHPREDFCAVVEDLFAGGGKLVATRGAGTELLTGLAFAVPEQEGGLVTDWTYDSPEAKEALAAGVLAALDVGETRSRSVACGEAGEVRGMARVIDAEQVLRLYARKHVEEEFAVRLTDEQLPVNSGTYVIKGGELSRGGAVHALPVVEMTIGELTRMVTSGGKNAPFMTLMLD